MRLIISVPYMKKLCTIRLGSVERLYLTSIITKMSQPQALRGLLGPISKVQIIKNLLAASWNRTQII